MQLGDRDCEPHDHLLRSNGEIVVTKKRVSAFVIDHLVRLAWLMAVTSSDEEPGLRLTDLGFALLHDHERETTKEDVSVVVLEAHDPLAYPKLVGQLNNAGAGMLVDPYLKLEGLAGIVTSTQLTRLLVSVKTGKPELAAMQTHLDSPRLTRRVEVRTSTKLHDRILLAKDRSVFTLGTSLNGVGSKTTVLTPMPSEAGAVVRELYEKLWTEADLVGPRPVEDEQDALEGEPRDDSTDDEGDKDVPGKQDGEDGSVGTDDRAPEE
jgi:hypothetical protein